MKKVIDIKGNLTLNICTNILIKEDALWQTKQMETNEVVEG